MCSAQSKSVYKEDMQVKQIAIKEVAGKNEMQQPNQALAIFFSEFP